MGKNAKLKAQRKANMERIQEARKEVIAARDGSSFYDEIKRDWSGYIDAEIVVKIDNVVKYCVAKHDELHPLSHLDDLDEDKWDAILDATPSLWDSFITKEVNTRLPFDRMFFEWESDMSRDGIYIEHEPEEDGGEYGIHAFTIIKDDKRTRFDNMGDFWMDSLGDLSAPPRWFDADRLPDYEVEQLNNEATYVFMSIAFMNCRNLEIIEHIPDSEVSGLHEKHFGVPSTKYKTLRIKQTGKPSNNGDTKEYQDLMPLHLRRGNFATYTDDAPLFGKYTGTFWRPATAVGSEKNGIVVKDYEVEA